MVGVLALAPGENRAVKKTNNKICNEKIVEWEGSEEFTCIYNPDVEEGNK